jgi:hypothetical protein
MVDIAPCPLRPAPTQTIGPAGRGPPPRPELLSVSPRRRRMAKDHGLRPPAGGRSLVR